MRKAVLSLLALAAMSGAAAAQPAVGVPAKAKSAPAKSAPAKAAGVETAAGVKRFGEFVVRCAQAKSVAPCDLYEERGDKNTGQRVIGFSIGFMPSGNRYIMQLAVPLGVAVDKGAIITDGKLSSPALPYRRCDRAGCYVEVAIDKSLVDAFGKMGNDAKIKVTADGGKIYDFTFSFDGFNAAHEDMVAENKAKASSVDAATDVH
jgi:invasion protein IalB